MVSSFIRMLKLARRIFLKRLLKGWYVNTRGILSVRVSYHVGVVDGTTPTDT